MKKVSNLQQIFALNVKIRRKKLGLTQAELAKSIEVSTSFVTEIETVRKAPSFGTIERIAEVLGTPAWTLFCEYSDSLNNDSASDDITRFLLKNKINEVIDDVLK